MSKSYPSVVAQPTDWTDWTDLVVATPAIGNKTLFLQNIGKNEIRVFLDGSTAPGADDGVILMPKESIQISAPHVWVRGNGATSLVAFFEV